MAKNIPQLSKTHTHTHNQRYDSKTTENKTRRENLRSNCGWVAAGNDTFLEEKSQPVGIADARRHPLGQQPYRW